MSTSLYFSTMIYHSLLFVLLGFFSARNNPTIEPLQTKQWFKGNLHTHTYWSDGDEYPELVLDWYKTHDYDFVALSDHNTLSRDEKWVKVVKSGFYEASFKKYVERLAQNG